MIMDQEMPPMLLKDEVYAVVGAAMAVHSVLGLGFLTHPVLEKRYRADLICYDQIIVEPKASSGLTGRDTAQLLNYLKASRMRLGLLFNFGSRSELEWNESSYDRSSSMPKRSESPSCPFMKIRVLGGSRKTELTQCQLP
jgi:hypothetical protein